MRPVILDQGSGTGTPGTGTPGTGTPGTGTEAGPAGTTRRPGRPRSELAEQGGAAARRAQLDEVAVPRARRQRQGRSGRPDDGDVRGPRRPEEGAPLRAAARRGPEVPAADAAVQGDGDRAPA